MSRTFHNYVIMSEDQIQACENESNCKPQVTPFTDWGLIPPTQGDEDSVHWHSGMAARFWAEQHWILLLRIFLQKPYSSSSEKSGQNFRRLCVVQLHVNSFLKYNDLQTMPCSCHLASPAGGLSILTRQSHNQV